MRTVTVISLVAAGTIVAGLGLNAIVGAQPAPAAKLGLVDDIAHIYHGIPLDRSFKEIKPTRATVEASLDGVIARFGTADSNKTFDRAIGLAKTDPAASPNLRIALKGAKAEMLLASTAYQSKITSNVAYLREWLKADTERSKEATRGTAKLNAGLATAKLKFNAAQLAVVAGWWKDFRITPLVLTYNMKCRLNGVPSPPDWGSSGWTKKTDGATTSVPYGDLYILDSSAYTTEVWTSGDSTTDGGCIALPRKNGSSITQGVICQRASTGKACFYDNRPHAGGATFSAAQMAGSKKKISTVWVNGDDAALSGGGVCTDCHRGENAFVLHNHTLLSNSPAMPFETDAAVWYTMLNSLGWSNPPKTTFSTSGGCTSCHEIGSTTDASKASYCAILEKAADREMPSTSSPATWSPSSGSSYKAHIDALKTNC